jgi:hypothetical protein
MEPIAKVLNLLLILSLAGGLLLSACSGQFSIDLNVGQGGEEGAQSLPANSMLFLLMIVMFVVVVALVVVAAR